MSKSNKTSSVILDEEPTSSISFAQKRKELALGMAELLYEIYKEQNDIIKNGQNNAQQNLSN